MRKTKNTIFNVWVNSDKLCAKMPALILDKNKFQPMWFIGIIQDGKVCIDKPDEPAIIRVGNGWGRNGKDEYYYVDDAGKVEKLKRVAVKQFDGSWKVCVSSDRVSRRCFKILDDGIYAIS